MSEQKEKCNEHMDLFDSNLFSAIEHLEALAQMLTEGDQDAFDRCGEVETRLAELDAVRKKYREGMMACHKETEKVPEQIVKVERRRWKAGAFDKLWGKYGNIVVDMKLRPIKEVEALEPVLKADITRNTETTVELRRKPRRKAK